MRLSSLALGSSGLLLAAFVALTGCGRLRASSVPLGGKHEEESAPAKLASAAPSARPAPVASLSSAEERAAEEAEEVAVQATPASGAKPVENATAGSPAAPKAFQLRPYSRGLTWTRVFDAEFDMKVGPGEAMEMRMVNHQEARFEVLAATGGNIDKLGIEYPIDTAKMTVMGREQNEPQVLAGKRYVVTFSQGKPDVKHASGGSPTKKELDSVKDDAREPQAMATALVELASLTAKGKGDFSLAGAIALAGGEDDDTKITSAKASLRQLSTGTRGEKSALLDIGYTLISTADDDLTIEMKLAGSMVVLDAPSRYHSITVHGPMSLLPKQPGGMAGKGNGKVTLSYNY